MAKTKATKTEKRVRMSTRRSANFTHHEKQVLLSLMQEYRHIVEDRHTDGVTVREKNSAWITLTNKYNAENDVSARSVKQLRQCWKNLKSRSRVDFLRVPGEAGSNDSGTLTLVPPGGTSSSSNIGSGGSGSALTLLAVGGMSNSTSTNDVSGSSPSNNTSSIDNAGTIILNNILTNNSNNINYNNISNNINSIRSTNGLSTGDLSSHSGSPGLTDFNQPLPSATAVANRQRPEPKTSSSNKKRKKKTSNNRKNIGPTATVSVEDGIDEEVTEVSRTRRKSRPSLVHLDYDKNGVLEDEENVAEVERPRRKIRPSVMHLDYDVSTTVDDDDDDDDAGAAVVADEDVSERLQVSVGYPHDSAVVVSQQGHSQEPEDVYPTDTLAVVSVSGSADRIHFNNHASSPDPDDIHHHQQSHEVNLHSQPQTDYRLSQHNPTSPHHLQIQPSAFQPTPLTANSNHLEDGLNHATGSGPDIKVFDSIRGFGKVLHSQNALPTHLVSHVTDGRTVHSVNLGPSINYSDEVDIVNNVSSSHTGPQILSTHGANDPQIPSIEPVLLEKVTSDQEHDPVVMDFRKTEHSERMKNIRLERKLIGIEHKARMELIKLKSEYVKMKMEILLHDRS